MSRTIWKLKQNYYHKLWNCLTNKEWNEFNRLLKNMKHQGIQYDEVIYTLKSHYYILDPNVASENAYLVIEEMKRSLIHPSIIRINQNLINSYFELEDIACEPPIQQWQNFTKLIWQTALKLNRQRRIDLKESLLSKDPNDVINSQNKDIEEMIKEEFMQHLFTPTIAIDETYDEPIDVNRSKFVHLPFKELDQKSLDILEHIQDDKIGNGDLLN